MTKTCRVSYGLLLQTFIVTVWKTPCAASRQKFWTSSQK
jgi:hypothetical protein